MSNANLLSRANRGDLTAQVELGLKLFFGENITRNQTEAVRWFRMAANGGSPSAQCWLARAYMSGSGVVEDGVEALHWFRKSASSGNANAQMQLGDHFVSSENYAEGMRWYRLAADQGEGAGFYGMGLGYSKGRGVPKDDTEALRFYHLAADSGYPPASLSLFTAYLKGLGVQSSERTALFWLKRGAEQDHRSCQLLLALAYEYGNFGLERDLDMALAWNAKAAERKTCSSEKANASPKERLPPFRQGAEEVSATSDCPTGIQSNTDSSEKSSLIPEREALMSLIDKAFDDVIGLQSVKHQVIRQANYTLVQKIRKAKGFAIPDAPARHLVFSGNPGTGKTTVARIVAQVNHHLGITKSTRVIEADRSSLVAAYTGQTAIKTRRLVESALGGVLFIDEAHALQQGVDDFYGREAVDTLVKMMEDHREELIVIIAGYELEMLALIESNPGLASRFNRHIRFPDYSPAELLAIFERLCEKSSFNFDSEDHIRAGLAGLFDRASKSDGKAFGNGRYVRNLFQRVVDEHSNRMSATDDLDNESLNTLQLVDFETAIGEVLPTLAAKPAQLKSALQEIDGLVGLEEVKKEVHQIATFLKIQELRRIEDLKLSQGFSQHLVFKGNPGTGKTTVARLIAKIYFASGIIPSSRVIEVDRASLVSEYLGQTATKVQQVIDQALGGILFIDEAYTLSQQGAHADPYGQEAIDALLKRMEDDRDNLVVIVAGYSERMETFIQSNPGLKSRFSRVVNFEDYKPDQLQQIFNAMCVAGEYYLAPTALELLSSELGRLYKAGRTSDNGRFIRNLFERCVLMQHQRLAANSLRESNLSDLKNILDFDISDAIDSMRASL